jgi:hypothetical protein
MNDLVDSFDEYKNDSEARHKSTDNTLARILETLHRLTPGNLPTVLQALAPSPSTDSIRSENQTFLSNPTPTAELISIISKVVSEARSRIGKKKGGADDNSCKVSSF